MTRQLRDYYFPSDASKVLSFVFLVAKWKELAYSEQENENGNIRAENDWDYSGTYADRTRVNVSRLILSNLIIS